MRLFGIVLTAFFVMALQSQLFSQSTKAEKKEAGNVPRTVLDFTMKNIDGKPVPLSSYKGSVVMIVNTASECGYTPQYETLQKLYDTYKDKGFRILAFPANNFGAQEPGSNADIKTFCSTKFHTTFDLFGKISVKGDDQHPLYRYITKESPLSGEIKWNFQKYLVDRNGNIKSKFLSAVDPMSKDVRMQVEKLLSEK